MNLLPRSPAALLACTFFLPFASAQVPTAPGPLVDKHTAEALHSQMSGKDQTAAEGSAQTPAGSMDPGEFVHQAALLGNLEVTLSREAQSKASSEATRRFADKMVQDHMKANEELSSLARSKGWNVPAALEPQQREVAQRVTDQQGSQFDSAYARQMETGHRETVALFERGATASDPDVAAFARKLLPTLRQHEHMAAQLPGTSGS